MAGDSRVYDDGCKVANHRNGSTVTITISHPMVGPYMAVRSPYWKFKETADNINAFALIPAKGKRSKTNPGGGITLMPKKDGTYTLEGSVQSWPELMSIRKQLQAITSKAKSSKMTVHTSLLVFPDSDVVRVRYPEGN